MTHVLFAWRRYTGAFYQDARPARPTPPSSPAQLQALLKAGRRNQLDADAPRPFMSRLPAPPGNRSHSLSHGDEQWPKPSFLGSSSLAPSRRTTLPQVRGIPYLRCVVPCQPSAAAGKTAYSLS